MSISEILDDVSSYLQYLKEEGVTAVEASREVVDALGKKVVRGAHAGGAGAGAADSLASAVESISQCEKCSLHETRTKVVPGQGSSGPDIMFIGEAPGYDEDQQGLAFVGRAGQLLTKMIEAMGFTREEVFIGNILKCRPPKNRNPLPEEMETCIPYLKEQIAILKPKVIVALGSIAVKGLLDTTVGITRLRGTWMTFEGIDTMPTFHPAYLLRNPSAKRDVWEDLKAVLRHLGRPIPEAKKRRT